MKATLTLLFTLILLSSPARANKLSFEEMKNFLSLDLKTEIKTVDFVDPRNVNEIVTSSPVSLNPLLKNESLILPVTGKKIESTHSIADVNKYIEYRLGSQVLTAVKSKDLRVKAFAGSLDVFFDFLKSQYPGVQQLAKIQSLYEEWGISKYLVKPAQGSMILYFQIPASLLFVQHYATMIQYLSPQANEVPAFVDSRSIDREKLAVHQAGERIRNSLGTSYDTVSFGYVDIWLTTLKQNQHWAYEGSQNITDSQSGISGNLIEIRHRQRGTKHKILLLNSKRTVWGELASFMMEAFLHKDLKRVLFMGSAGAVSGKNLIYDLSVPSSFVDQTGEIQIENLFSQKKAIYDDSKINFGARHGNTFSPLEQDINFVKKVHRKRIDTVDVEQSLIARTLTTFNKTYKTAIQFGAINVITDRPFDVLKKENSSFNLDRVDHAQKQAAKYRAVDLILESLDQIEPQMRSCRAVFN